MMVRIDEVLCQRCGVCNSLANEFCSRCGTPLMLIANPAQHRFEDLATAEPHGEHLLERISILEHRLVRVIGIAERSVEMCLRQSELGEHMCEMIRSLTETVLRMQDQERERIELTERLAREFAAACEAVGSPERKTPGKRSAPARAASQPERKPRRAKRGAASGS